MVIREQFRQTINNLGDGIVVTASDFDIPRQYRSTLIKALNQYADSGVLKRVSKGRYYKPRQSRFGELQPPEKEIIKDFLEKDGKIIGYITGIRAFNGLALTTQLSSAIMIGTNQSRRPVTRGSYKISFLLQPNPIKEKDIPLLVLLDALRLVKEIPATTPDEVIFQISEWIKKLSASEHTRLLKLVQAYQPYVMAQLGAIFESAGIQSSDLEKKLNPLTRYKLGITPATLPTATKWNIV